jgi:hypothetical protein
VIGFGWSCQVAGSALAGAPTAPEMAGNPAVDGASNGSGCPFDGALRGVTLPSFQEHVRAPKKEAWERAHGGPEGAQASIRARLLGWPAHLVAPRGTLPATDREFAQRVARDTWRGLDAFTDRENGLPIDNVRFTGGSAPVTDAHVGDYTSTTNIGLHLVAVAAARELGFLTQAQAVGKLQRLLATLAQLETHHGFFFNYYDTTSLERTSNFVSFVDSSWLAAGLMVARMTFPEVYEPCTALLQRMDFGFFYDPVKRQLSHGYYVNLEKRSPYHYGVLYTEARLGSLIAIGKGDVPPTHWFHMVRTYPAGCGGQSLTPLATKVKTIDGERFSAGYYEWNGLRYVPSWGGSMFEALMPTLVVDEVRHAPKSLGVNDRVHAEVQRRYALEQLGYRVWGISPSATAVGDSYGEYGVRILGSRGYEAGAVTPHAAALALSVEPGPAIANLRALATLYDIYGDFGFFDAVDPFSGAVAHKYLALDQSMLFIALANYLGDHCVQKRFAADAFAQKAFPIIGAEDFFN